MYEVVWWRQKQQLSLSVFLHLNESRVVLAMIILCQVLERSDGTRQEPTTQWTVHNNTDPQPSEKRKVKKGGAGVRTRSCQVSTRQWIMFSNFILMLPYCSEGSTLKLISKSSIQLMDWVVFHRGCINLWWRSWWMWKDPGKLWLWIFLDSHRRSQLNQFLWKKVDTVFIQLKTILTSNVYCFIWWIILQYFPSSTHL